MAVTSRPLWLVLAAVGCSAPSSQGEPVLATSTAQSPLTRTGIEGCNCAGAAPAMTAPDGAAYPFQSIVSYYYEALQAFWTRVGSDDVLKTWLPASIEASDEEFYAWQAKTVQIYRDRDLLGFAHRYYRGVFGFLAGEGGAPEACTPALDAPTRTTGMLAHVGLSQAGVCGRNDDGTTKFWQVNHIVLLMIGDVVDAFTLVDAGIARVVAVAPADQCILAMAGPPTISAGGVPVVPCRVAYRDDAVTEGVVLPVPSSAVVDGVALRHRAFTAAGTVVMPNQLDEVRKILRDGQLRAMYAIGRPRFAPEPSAGPTQVRLVGHAIGPAASPSSVLLPDERAWVDAPVGGYQDRCCHLECGAPAGGASSMIAPRDAVSILGARGTIARDAGVSDAIVRADAALPDAALPDAGVSLPDAGVSLPDAGVMFPDAGVMFPDAGVMFPDAGVTFPGGGPTNPGGGPTNPGGGPTNPGGGPTNPGGGPTNPGGGPPVDAAVDAPSTPPPPPGDAGAPTCRMTCVPEGVCVTSSAATGLVVMVSAQTTKECNGNCPEPARDAPTSQPTCAP